MTFGLSSNTKAILLLTAPLIAGRSRDDASVKPLGAGEYRRLARWLRESQREPADLLNPEAREIVNDRSIDLDPERLERLLGRGLLLAQAVERWRTRAIWVLSRADAGYPRRLKQRLRGDAPPVLYGCGDAGTLGTGGLAVVGSRDVHEALIEYTENAGRLAASAGCGLVSGGARGVDRAAMRGALESGGRVVGVLADGLEKAAMLREHREALRERRLVLVSPYDPAARFQVGHAMRRNKLIYALADAALVVNSDYGKGGTWTGAIEQLDKLKLVPVYVRANGEMGKGLAGLRERGAIPWPEPETPEALKRILDAAPRVEYGAPAQQALSMDAREAPASSEDVRQAEPAAPVSTPETAAVAGATPADVLFATVRELIERMDGLRTEDTVADTLAVTTKQAGDWLVRFAEEKIGGLFKGANVDRTEAEIVDILQVSRKQVRACLKRLVENGVLDKLARPVRYRSESSVGALLQLTELKTKGSDMRIEDSEGKAVNNLDDWETLIRPEHWQPGRGRSAYSLAEFIIKQNGADALRKRVATVLGEPVVFDKGVPEHEVRFDRYGKGRFHDLGIFGKADSGKSLFVGVEAKVDECFGEYVSVEMSKAKQIRNDGTRTHLPERIRELCARFGPGITEESDDIPYPLLYSAAGTVDGDADLSVFYVVVFRTYAYDADKGKRNHEDYRRFVERAGGEPIQTGDDGAEAHVLTVGGKQLHAIHEYVNLDRSR